jgi:hypothetical protein
MQAVYMYIPATIYREKKDKEKGRRCYTSYHTQREERQRKGKEVLYQLPYTERRKTKKRESSC